MDPEPKEQLDAALAYAKRGWPVFPIHSVADGQCSCGDLSCRDKGKHPRTPHGFHEATTDETHIRTWFRRWPRSNIGIRTGAVSGIFVLDVDKKANGPETLASLEAHHGRLPATLVQGTGGGGAHHIYRYPADGKISCRTGVAPGLDVRGEGGYVVAAPSVHESGRAYEWQTDPLTTEIAEAPSWLLEFCRSKRAQGQASRSSNLAPESPPDIDRIRDALQHINADDRDVWIRVGAGLRHELGESGRPLWDGWSQTSPKFNDRDQDRTWSSLGDHPDPATLGTIFHLARENGWPGPSLRLPSGTNGTSSQASWPPAQPLPRLAPVLGFDLDLLPREFQPWIWDIAERMQCPIEFVAVGAMVAAGSALGRKLGIKPKARDLWIEVPNLWGAIIGRPGILKTPALREVMHPLVELELTEKENYESLRKTYDAESLVQKAQAKKDEDDLKKHLGDQKKAGEIARRAVERPAPPKRRRYIVHDTTVEKLGELLADSPNGLLLFRDELTGFFASLDRRGQECARSFILECWDGKSRFTYDRIGRGTVDIECATPSGNAQNRPVGNA